MQRCKSCGSESPDQARFCGSCGFPLNASAEREVTVRSAHPLEPLGTVITDRSIVSTGPLPDASPQNTSAEQSRVGETQTQQRSNPSASQDKEQEEGSGALLVDTSVPLIPVKAMPIVPSTPPIGSVPVVQGTPSTGGAPIMRGTPVASNPPATTSPVLPQQSHPPSAQPQHLQSLAAQPPHSQPSPALPQHSQPPLAQPQHTEALFCGYCGRPLNSAATRIITNVGTRIDKTKTQRGSGPPTREGTQQEDEYSVVLVDTAVPLIPAQSVPMVQGTPVASHPPTTTPPTQPQHGQPPPAQPQHLQAPVAHPQHTQTPSARPQQSQLPQVNISGAPTVSAPPTGVSVAQGTVIASALPAMSDAVPVSLAQSSSSSTEKNSKGKGVTGRATSKIQRTFAKDIPLRRAGKPALSAIQIGIIILILLILGSIAVYGLVHNFHLVFPIGNLTLSKAASSLHRPTPTIGPASSAIVSIVPMHIIEQGTYTITAITGTPNGAKQQVFAHTVTATTTSVSKTVNATGQGTTQGTHAKGMLRVRNPYSGTPRGVDMTYAAGTIFDDDPGNSPNVQMTFEATITVPGDGTSVTVPAEVVQIGTIGNISQIRGWTHYGAYGDPAPLDIDNSTPFTGGTDSQPYSYVQQSDIDTAANDLVSANTPNAQDAQQVVQGQVKAGERLIGTPQCSPNQSADQSAGDHASQVTITVSFACSGEVYDYAGALRLAQSLLRQHIQQLYPTTSFASVGTVTTTMRQEPTLDTSSGTVTMIIEARGVWVAQFDTKQEQSIARAIAGKTGVEAQALLNAQVGIKTASIYLQGGNGDILPTNPAQITFTIQSTSGKAQ